MQHQWLIKWWTKALVLLIVFTIVAPPPVLAQMFGGSSGQQQGTSPGGGGMSGGGGLPGFGGTPGLGGLLSGGLGASQGQAILTNPTALQQLVPTPTPCPLPVQSVSMPDVAAPSLNEIWPMETANLLPSSIEQRMRQERESKEDQRDKELHEKEKAEREREIQEQLELQKVGLPPNALTQTQPQTSQSTPGAGAATGQSYPGGQMPQAQFERKAKPGEETKEKDYSIEEAFAKFSVLQGVKSRLKQFGYDFFDAQATGFAPVMDVPVGPDYIIGPQDSLAIHVWNVPDSNFNRSYIALVERDGMLVIPQAGAIPVGGLTFSQAERAIHTRLAGLLKRFEVHVAMARLRTMKIYVVGEVVRPGAYEVSSLATISNAVYAACGPLRSGSLRQVKVVREGKTAAELDFYDFLQLGDRSHDRRLQNGDVVVVPPLGAAAAISGGVRRSAIYELVPGSRLSDLLRLAGGLTPVADQRRCHIFRLEPGQGRIMIDVDLAGVVGSPANGKERSSSTDTDTLLKDGDYVRIASLPTQVGNVVSLAGAVMSPGPYEFRTGMRLHDLLRPEQLTIEAYVDRAEIIRTDPITYQAKVIQFSPKALFEGQQGEDHPLQRLDQVVVASQVRPPNLVIVEGEVKRPGYFTVETGEHLSSVLRRAGGFTSNAFPQGIVLIRESVKKKQQAEIERFIATERQRLSALSASAASGAAGIAGGAAVTGYGQLPEQQILNLRLQQLEAAVSRLELGRVVIRMESIEKLEGTDDDLRLEARDRIVIPTPPQTVSVIGSVKNPSNVVYRIGLRLDDYLQQAGGPNEEASTKEMYVMRANGTTEAAYVKLKDVQPGDTIVVPQKVEAKTPAVALWSAVAATLGSIMLGVAAISVIGR